MKSNTSIQGRLMPFVYCLLAITFLSACGTLTREPGLSRQPSETPQPATPTQTPVPVIEINNLTLRKAQAEGSWEIFGMIENISDEGLVDLELSLAIMGTDGEVQTQGIFQPALRQLAPGESTAFKTNFSQVEEDVLLEEVVVQLDSFIAKPVTTLQVAVDEVDARPNYEGGKTYLGYFSNEQRKHVEIRNVEAFMLDEAGNLIAGADRIISLSSIEPRGRIPFLAEFYKDYDGSWPEFYIDTIPAEDPDTSSTLWTVTESQLFFTTQGLPYYLVEVKNTSFAPQNIEGIFTLIEGSEILSVLPVISPAPIPAQSTWFFTLEPSLDLPVRLRDDEQALRALIADVTLDPIATRGVSDGLVPIDLTIDSIEVIGGSIFLQGTISNTTEQGLNQPVIYATLWNSTGNVISASHELGSQEFPVGALEDFTISLRIPAGVEPNTLEFDLNAIATIGSETTQGQD